MALTKTQQVRLLAVLLAAIAGIVLYHRFAEEAPATRPLTFTRGMSVAQPIRRGSVTAASDPISVLLARRAEVFPGTARDLFRLAGENGPVKTKQRPVVVTAPVQTVTAVTATPVVPEKTPEEIAREQSKADLSKFRFLGYLTDKDSSLFLSKDGELFIAKSGDTLLQNYRIKSAGKDHVVLIDTGTRVEVRVELTGSTK